MLWNDSIFVALSDLADLDSEIPTIATDENVTLDGENGFIRRQIDECGEEILRRMEVFGGWIGSSTLSANHIQAVLNIGGGAAASRVKILLDQVVVSDRIGTKWSHLMRWVVYRTVTQFWRSVYSRTASKDRYKSKLTEYTKEMRRHQVYVLEDLGLPICYQPLARPAAAFNINPGTWDQSNVSAIVDNSANVAGSYEIAVTYLDSTRYVSARNDKNAQSAPSDRLTAQLTSGHTLSTDISSLIPPDGYQDPGTMALCVYTPLSASHWNLWVGKQGQTLWLQNPNPIPISQKAYAIAGNPTIGGIPIGLGQYADRRYAFQRLLQRA